MFEALKYNDLFFYYLLFPKCEIRRSQGKPPIPRQLFPCELALLLQTILFWCRKFHCVVMWNLKWNHKFISDFGNYPMNFLCLEPYFPNQIYRDFHHSDCPTSTNVALTRSANWWTNVQQKWPRCLLVSGWPASRDHMWDNVVQGFPCSKWKPGRGKPESGSQKGKKKA